jgi:uncharacterized integral membrane protein
VSDEPIPPADDDPRRPGRPGGEPTERDEATSGPASRGAGAEPAAGATGTPLTQQLGRIVLVALLVLVVVFGLVNSQPVDFSWVFGTTEVVEVGGERVSGGVPLIVLLFGAFAVGALIGALFEWQFLRKRQNRPERRKDDRGRRRRR